MAGARDPPQQHDRDVSLSRFELRQMTFRHVRFARHGLARHSTNVAQLPNAFAKETEEITIGSRCHPVETRNLGIGAWTGAHTFTNRICIIIHPVSVWSKATMILVGHID